MNDVLAVFGNFLLFIEGFAIEKDSHFRSFPSHKSQAPGAAGIHGWNPLGAFSSTIVPTLLGE